MITTCPDGHHGCRSVGPQQPAEAGGKLTIMPPVANVLTGSPPRLWLNLLTPGLTKRALPLRGPGLHTLGGQNRIMGIGAWEQRPHCVRQSCREHQGDEADNLLPGESMKENLREKGSEEMGGLTG